MTDTLTESFCERCGTRYSFEKAAKRRRVGLGRVRVLTRGLKNYVANDGLPMTEAMAAARDDEARAGTGQQLDAFHAAFNFCMTCRQYTCSNCWNTKAGECLTCAPDVTREILPAPFPELPAAGPVERGNGHAAVEAMTWPRADLERDLPGDTSAGEAIDVPASEPAVEEFVVEGSAAGEELGIEEPAVLARLDAFIAVPPAAGVDELTPEELAEIEQALSTTHPDAEADAAVPEPEIVPVLEAAPEPEIAPEPVLEAEPEIVPVPEAAPEPEIVPVLEAAPEPEIVPALEAAPEPEIAPEPEPVLAPEPEPVLAPEPEPVLEAAPEPEIEAAGAPAAALAESPAAEPAVAESPAAESPAVPAAPGDRAEAARGQTRRLLGRFRPGRPAGAPPAAEPTTLVAAAAVQAAQEPEPVAVPPAPALESEPVPVTAEAAPQPAPAPEPEPAPLAAGPAPEPEPAPVAAGPAPQPAPAPEPAPLPVAAEAPTDIIEQPRWQVVAPDGAPTVPTPPAAPMAPTTWPDAPSWPSSASTPRPGTVPGPAAAPWASRLATARPEPTGVWAASSQEVLAAPTGAAHGAPAVQACVSCGLSLSANARFCRRCGTRQA